MEYASSRHSLLLVIESGKGAHSQTAHAGHLGDAHLGLVHESLHDRYWTMDQSIKSNNDNLAQLSICGADDACVCRARNAPLGWCAPAAGRTPPSPGLCFACVCPCRARKPSFRHTLASAALTPQLIRIDLFVWLGVTRRAAARDACVFFALFCFLCSPWRV